MGKRLIRWAACAVLAAAPLAGASLAVAAQPAGGFYPLELTAGSRLVIAARVNGQDTQALLDSAAEMTLVDAAFARQLGLAAGEHAVGQGSGKSAFDAQVVNGVTLTGVGVELPNQSVAVVDLSDVGQRLLGRRIDVILGRELFDATRLEIDIERRRIRVLPAGERPRGRRLALSTEHGVETLAVSVEGHSAVHATFDLGNGSHVLIARAYAEQLGLLKDGRAVRLERGGGLGGETERQVLTLGSLELAGRRLTDVTAAIDSNSSASDLNVGVAVLRHFVITTDFPAHALWLAPLP